MNFIEHLREFARTHAEGSQSRRAFEEAADRLGKAAETFNEIADTAEEATAFEPDPYFQEIKRTASTAAIDMVTR